jgi:integrase
MARRKKKPGRRRFGKVRVLPSGRYQASYLGADGLRRTAARTFETEDQADDWLIQRQAELLRGDWNDPNRGKVALAVYGREWIDDRHELRPRTAELYHYLFDRYVEEKLGHLYLSDIDPQRVRQWRSQLVKAGVSATMTAKAYRLLRAILMTATDDELIPRNPCRIKAGGKEPRAERPVLTVRQVFQIAELVPTRFRAMILVTTFASLRFGEVTALRRVDVDTMAGTVSVRQTYTEVKGEGLILGPPKSRAGYRTVALPSMMMPDLLAHLDEYVRPDPDALVFTGPKGAPVRRGNFHSLMGWVEARAKIGVPGLHFHDLRYTGNTLAAGAGVSTKDLMARMGHDSVEAALIYQHATSAADQAVASKLNDRSCASATMTMTSTAAGPERWSRSRKGTRGARPRNPARQRRSPRQRTCALTRRFTPSGWVFVSGCFRRRCPG